MIYDCLFIVTTDGIVNDENGQPDYANSWDGTNLDTTLCDTVVEDHDSYYSTFEEGALNLPTEFYVLNLDDEQNGIVVMMDLMSDNGITMTMSGVTVDECEGTYNADDDTCVMEPGAMVVAHDESMMIWSNSEDGEEMIVLYQFDYATNSGVMMGLISEDDDNDDDHHDDDDHHVFYCSNDGEEYATSMGGILCPEGAGEVPTCPDGEPCICIDVDGSCTDGDDDWGYEGHDGHDHGDHDGHDNGDHDDNDDHMMAYDWMIDTEDMMSETEVIGAYADYHIVLANCQSESSDDMTGSETMSCGDDVLKLTIADATAPGADIMFHDADSSGTITAGDMIHINPEIDAGGEWNTVRLYSVDADKYSDENPMMTPGFTAFAGIVALLGAALLTRRD